MTDHLCADDCFLRGCPKRRLPDPMPSEVFTMPAADTGEVRVVDPDTGGAKGQKKQRMDLVPPLPLLQLAEVYGYGAGKYDDHNWRKGYAWSLSFAAMQRHLWAFWNGEDLDPESGLPHVAHAAFHCFALLQFMQDHPNKDDRPHRAEP